MFFKKHLIVYFEDQFPDNKSYCVCVCMLSCLWLSAAPWTVDRQAPLFMEYSRQDTGVGCHFLLLLYVKGSVQFTLVIQSCRLCTPLTAAHQASVYIANSQSLLKLMPAKSMMPSNRLILCHPLLHLPSIFPSIRVFSNESALRISLPKYRSFSFSISPSSEHPGLIFLRMEWLDLFAVQGTLKSLIHHTLKASTLQR